MNAEEDFTEKRKHVLIPSQKQLANRCVWITESAVSCGLSQTHTDNQYRAGTILIACSFFLESPSIQHQQKILNCCKNHKIWSVGWEMGPDHQCGKVPCSSPEWALSVHLHPTSEEDSRPGDPSVPPLYPQVLSQAIRPSRFARNPLFSRVMRFFDRMMRPQNEETWGGEYSCTGSHSQLRQKKLRLNGAQASRPTKFGSSALSRPGSMTPRGPTTYKQK